MRKLELRKIEIENFRGIRQFSTDFGETCTVIKGDNSTGKSTVFAAFMWALFGKDEQDRKDFEILPCENAVPQRVTAKVTLHLLDGGMFHVLRREYSQNWVKHKGQVEESYEGNETKCFWDEAPISVTEYKKRVGELVDEQLFKMLTNPNFFPTMHWKDQRQALFSIIPPVSDADIAERDEAFKSLLTELGGKPLADFRKEINGALKTLREKAREYQPRIDELRRLIPESLPDRDALEEESKALAEELKAINEAATSAAEALKQRSAALMERRREADKLYMDAEQLVKAAKSKELERVAAANADMESVQRALQSSSSRLNDLERDMKSHQTRIDNLNAELKSREAEKERLREEYFRESQAVFNGYNQVCPTCGQPMPQEMIDKAVGNFNAEKQRRVDAVIQRGNNVKAQVEATKADIAAATAKCDEVSAKIEDERKYNRELTDKLAGMTKTEPADIVPESVEGYAELISKAKAIESEIKESETGMVGGESEETKARRTEIAVRAQEISKSLFDIDSAERNRKRIVELEDESRDTAQQIADYERKVFTADKFEQERIKDLDARVNGMFRHVTWRLFDKTIEGNIVETCVPIVGNALYPVANSAAKLNAGLDIIHVLSQHHGVSCPIFIDNAEGVVRIDGYDMQLVKLYVVEGEPLTVTDKQ